MCRAAFDLLMRPQPIAARSGLGDFSREPLPLGRWRASHETDHRFGNRHGMGHKQLGKPLFAGSPNPDRTGAIFLTHGAPYATSIEI